ncbi:MAG: TetR/AcrR family transcriptional regulator [Firmicutes bacterium]|nr:TetR/AcrR family transcriptional regulator [Bacillota bacterium]
MARGGGARGTADRGERILRAALEVMAERGYAAATVRDITDRAGVAAGTFYLYYPAKEAVGLALVDALYRAALAAAASARRGAPSPEEKLMRSMRAVLAVFARDPALSRFVLLLAPGAHPAFDERLREVHEALCTLVRDDVAEILGGRGDGRSADLASQAVVGAVGEVVTSWVRQGAPAGGLDDAAEVLSRLFGRGLGGLVP